MQAETSQLRRLHIFSFPFPEQNIARLLDPVILQSKDAGRILTRRVVAARTAGSETRPGLDLHDDRDDVGLAAQAGLGQDGGNLAAHGGDAHVALLAMASTDPPWAMRKATSTSAAVSLCVRASAALGSSRSRTSAPTRAGSIPSPGRAIRSKPRLTGSPSPTHNRLRAGRCSSAAIRNASRRRRSMIQAAPSSAGSSASPARIRPVRCSSTRRVSSPASTRAFWSSAKIDGSPQWERSSAQDLLRAPDPGNMGRGCGRRGLRSLRHRTPRVCAGAHTPLRQA